MIALMLNDGPTKTMVVVPAYNEVHTIIPLLELLDVSGLKILAGERAEDSFEGCRGQIVPA
jgi:hypothetical protein